MSIRDDKINNGDYEIDFGCLGFIFTIVLLTGIGMLLITFL